MFMVCLGLVIWQFTNSWKKYRSRPQGSDIAIINNGQTIFPEITICSGEDPYKEDELQPCGVSQ